MNEHAVTIGAINLEEFEVPASIQYGGKHRLAIHRTSDGTRTIEPLGPDDGEISFQGIFSGENAEKRARALDNLRLSGTVVWLTWRSFRYKVVVASFSAAYHSRSWIPYKLSCVVVHQLTAAKAGALSTQARIIRALLNARGSLTSTQVDITGLMSTMGGNGAFTSGSTANSLAVVSANEALSVIQSEVDLQSDALSGLELNSGTSTDAVSSFTSQVGCSEDLAKAVSGRSYISLVSALLNVTGE